MVQLPTWCISTLEQGLHYLVHELSHLLDTACSLQELFPESYAETAAWLRREVSANGDSLAQCEQQLKEAVEQDPHFQSLAAGCQVCPAPTVLLLSSYCPPSVLLLCCCCAPTVLLSSLYAAKAFQAVSDTCTPPDLKLLCHTTPSSAVQKVVCCAAFIAILDSICNLKITRLQDCCLISRAAAVSVTSSVYGAKGLTKLGSVDWQVAGRTKSLFSTMKKLLRLDSIEAGGRARQEVHDILASRCVVTPRPDLPQPQAEELARQVGLGHTACGMSHESSVCLSHRMFIDWVR